MMANELNILAQCPFCKLSMPYLVPFQSQNEKGKTLTTDFDHQRLQGLSGALSCTMPSEAKRQTLRATHSVATCYDMEVTHLSVAGFC